MFPCPVNIFLYESGLSQSCSTLVLRHPHGQAVEGKLQAICAAFPVIEDCEVSVTFEFPGCSFAVLAELKILSVDMVFLSAVFSLRIAISAATISLFVRQVLTLK